MAVDKYVDSGKLNNALTATANSIRSKAGGSSPIPFDMSTGKGFKDAVDAIQTGITPSGSINITQNGTYDVTEKAQAVVNVSGQAPVLKTKNITANGTYNASSDNADGYSSVTVNVPSVVTSKTWTITVDANKTASYNLVTDDWLKEHYNDSGLLVMIFPQFTLPSVACCAISMGTNFVTHTVTGQTARYGFRGYKTATGTNTSTVYVSDPLTGSASGAGQLGIRSDGTVRINAVSSYPLLAGSYKIIAMLT